MVSFPSPGNSAGSMPGSVPRLVAKNNVSVTRPRELESIQALRALAATTVIAVHIPFLRWGTFGVDIFFVVSGFIICYISSINANAFFLKRVFRIVPLYWLGTMGVFALGLFVPKLLTSTTANFTHLLKSLFFVPYLREDGTVRPVLFLGWTLNYEMFFYALFAAALAWNPKKAVSTVTVLLSAAVTLGLIFKPTTIVLRFYSNPIILEFAFGALAFLLWRRHKSKVSRIPILVAVVLSAAAYAVLWLMDARVISIHETVLRFWPSVILRGLPALLLFMSFLSLEGKLRFPKWLLAVGDASYSLYLFHPYLIELFDKKVISLKHPTPLVLATLVLTVFLCFGFAVLSYRLVERPSNEFLRQAFLKSTGGAPRKQVSSVPESVRASA